MDVNIQAAEDALMNGRDIKITIEFVREYDGSPRIDLLVEENCKLLFADIGLESIEEAINSFSRILEKRVP